MKRTLAVVTLLALTSAVPATPDAAEIDTLIRRLGAPRFADRERAEEELSDCEAAVPALRLAAVGGDPEVRRRAAELLRKLEPRVALKELRAVGHDLGGLEHFVRRMTAEEGFATEERWAQLESAVDELRKTAAHIADRPTPGPTPDWSKLTLKTKADTPIFSSARLLTSKPLRRFAAISDSIVVCRGPLAEALTVSNSILIVRGDIGRCSTVRNSIVICLGRIHQFSSVRDSSVFAAGGVGRTALIEGSVIDSPRLVTSVSRRNVYLAGGELSARRSAEDRMIGGEGLLPALFGSDRAALGADFAEGKGKVVVAEWVVPGSDLSRAGLRDGDELLAVAGKPVEGLEGLRGLFPAGWPTEPLALRVRRGGAEVSLTVALPSPPAVEAP